jgi:hypothetical protein
MSSLYIGNTTKQIHEFHYRVPEVEGVRIQQIPIGGQVLISGTLSTPQIDYIVKQHEKYGLVRADEVDRTRPFIGLCWSDRPITAIKLERALRHNDDVLADRGREMRERGAIAEHNRLENNLAESGRPELLRGLEVSVQEEHPERRPSEDGPALAEGYSVSRDNPRGAPTPRPGRGGRGRRAA